MATTQLPTIQWAEFGTPISDAAGMFLAAQEQAARRRLAERAQAEQERAQRDIEARDRERIAQAKQAHADRQKQIALENERTGQDRGASQVSEINAATLKDPMLGAALASRYGMSLAPMDRAAELPPVAPPSSMAGEAPENVPGAIQFQLGGKPKEQIAAEAAAAGDQARTEAVTRAEQQWQETGRAVSLSMLMAQPETERQQPGMAPTASEESLMLAAIAGGRSREADQGAVARQGADAARSAETTRLQAEDKGRYVLTGPDGKTQTLDPAAPVRYGRELDATERNLAGDKIAAMGANMIQQLASGPTPTPLDQLNLYKGDFKFVEELVRGGAIPSDKLGAVTEELNFLMRERGDMKSDAFRAAAMQAVARIKGPGSKPQGTSDLPLDREARTLLDSVARRGDLRAAVKSYQNVVGMLSDLESGNDALVRRALGLMVKEASGGGAVITPQERQEFQNDVGGKGQGLLKAWNTWTQTDGTPAIPKAQLDIFRDSLKKAIQPRAAKAVNTVRQSIDAAFDSHPNTGLRKYKDWALGQVLSTQEEPAAPAGDAVDEVMKGLGL